MKKSRIFFGLLFFLFFGIIETSQGQSNVFPKSGFAGIGTTSPSSQLHIRTKGKNNFVTVEAQGPFQAGLLLRNSTGPNNFIFTQAKSGSLTFQTENRDRMVLDSRGNVGIGTINPRSGSRLHLLTEGKPSFLTIEARGKYHAGIRFKNSLGINNYLFTNPSSGNLTFQTENSDRMTLDLNGRLGIGTTNPQTKLDVNGTTTTKVLEITGGADIAELFPATDSPNLAKGSVVIIDENNPGNLKKSSRPYDFRVAGVVSGGNGVKTGLTLNQNDIFQKGLKVAITGRVYTLSNTSNGRINPGDLLTTSAIPGEAMKVTDFKKSQGAVIGKAMSSLENGSGLVLVLVALQ